MHFEDLDKFCKEWTGRVLLAANRIKNLDVFDFDITNTNDGLSITFDMNDGIYPMSRVPITINAYDYSNSDSWMNVLNDLENAIETVELIIYDYVAEQARLSHIENVRKDAIAKLTQEELDGLQDYFSELKEGIPVRYRIKK